MHEFWKKQFDEYPEAEGIDFVPIGTMPWSLNKQIFQSNIKSDFENPHLPTPRSSRLFWKMENEKKKYILTPELEAIFHKEFCTHCGSQRCLRDSEDILQCGYYKDRPKSKSKKRIDLTLKYNFIFYPETVGLNDNCTKQEFYKAVEDWLNDTLKNPPDEIETEYLEEDNVTRSI